jgi:ComF family protein
MNILDLLFPKTCLECKKEGKYLCEACLSKLPSVKQVCPVCLRPSVDGFTHTKCIKPLGINGIISLWPYRGVIRSGILALKYKFVKEVSEDLSLLVMQKVKDFFLFQKGEGILTTIPLYWSRKNFRGYNQVDEIGESISKNFNMSFYNDLLFRKKLKTPQVTLSQKDRIKNIQGVFALNPKYETTIKNTLLIVLDDVYTTGSTLKEAAKVLKRNGAGKVWGLTIAR